MLKGMGGWHGAALPDVWLAKGRAFAQWQQAHGCEFTQARGLVPGGLLNWIAILLAVVWFAPNTQQIMARYAPALGIPRDSIPARRLAWRPTPVLGIVVALLAFAVLVNPQRQSEFLYFQF